MPIYEYRCNNCGSCFEKIVFASDDDKSFVCDNCGKNKIVRVMSPFSCVNTEQAAGGCSHSGGFS